MKLIVTLFFVLLSSITTHAQFIDEFEEDITGWDYFTGDGQAEVNFTARDGIAYIEVDATNDEHNVWWAIIKRNIASDLDLDLLSKPGYELRVEAKVRIQNAPKRLNFMINTQRTVDFHKQLREYDIDSDNDWHIISMTTEDLDVVPGDDLNVQLGVTDWGLGTYTVELDYYKASVVQTETTPADLGEPLRYHPPHPSLSSFNHHLVSGESSVINTDFPNVNFSNWSVNGLRLLTVSGNQWVILKWDFSDLDSKTTQGSSVLELTTQSFQMGGNYDAVFGEELGIEFGKVRIIEILGGDADWKSETVTYQSLTKGGEYAEVFNTQMIFDTEVSTETGSKTFITLSRPVTQRLLDGTTKGLLIRPLGAVVASFKTGDKLPVLHLNTSE